jgi:hypothetical protein
VAIKDLIVKGTMQAYRRMSIKRIEQTGNYESDWFEISKYVSKWGQYNESYGDNIYYGDYQIDNVQIELNNRDRAFNEPTDSRSIFSGYKTRYRTKFKIEIGLIDDDENELEGKIFYGLLFAEPITSDNNRLIFQLASYLKILQLYPGSGISQATGTTADFIDRLVKKEVNGVRLFDRIFEGANDSEKYQISTDNEKTISSPSIPDDASCWDLIKKYALFQNAIIYVNNSGNLIVASREPTADFQWKFNGSGNFYDNDYAINIANVLSQIDGVSQSYNRVVIEYNQDTYYTSEDSWTPGDSSLPDLYGEKTYNVTALDVTLAEATTIADDLQSKLKTPQKRWRILTTFIPHLNVNDKVEINYTGESIVANPFTLDNSLLAPSRTADTGIYDPLTEFSGSINLSEISAKIIGMNIPYDMPLICEFELQEI